jgi:phage terminase large subunit
MAQDGLRAVCIREVQKSLEQSVKRLLEDRVRDLGLAERFRILNTHIETPGDGRIIFHGMQNHTAESIKSLEGYDVAWVEEAQSLSQRSLDLLRPTIRKEGSELWFSWNPRSSSDPVDSFLRADQPPPNSIVVKTGWQDNPWLPDELRTELEYDRKRDPEHYAHVWGGEYQRRSEARVFRNWRVEEFETPANARFYLGADWGFSVDPAVMVRCFIEGRGLYIDQESYLVGCELDYLPFLFGGCQDEELRRINHQAWESLPQKYKSTWRGVGGARQWPCVADSQRPDTISYLKRHGFPRVTEAKKGAGSVEEGIEFLRAYDIVVHPRCQRSIDELTNYSYKTDRLTEEVLPVLEDKKNHVIDSLRYAVERLRHATVTQRRHTHPAWG